MFIRKYVHAIFLLVIIQPSNMINKKHVLEALLEAFKDLPSCRDFVGAWEKDQKWSLLPIKTCIWSTFGGFDGSDIFQGFCGAVGKCQKSPFPPLKTCTWSTFGGLGGSPTLKRA